MVALTIAPNIYVRAGLDLEVIANLGLSACIGHRA